MNIREFPIPRQKVLIGAGLGLVAAVWLRARHTARSPKRRANPARRPRARPQRVRPHRGGPAPAANAIAKTADVPVGSGVIVDKVVVTQPSAGVFKGFSAKCTHKGCIVDKIADGTIDCPCHGSKFNLDGSVANGPARSRWRLRP